MSRPLIMAVAELKPDDMARQLHDTYEVVTDFAAGAKAQIALTSGAVGFSAAQMDMLPNLRLIAVNGVGVDAIDLPEAARRGIIVTNTPGVLTLSVAEMALGLAFALTRRIAEGDSFVRQGKWASGGKLALGSSLLARRAGILGYGRIGRQLADLLRALGMEVLYTSRTQKTDTIDQFCPDAVSLAQDCDVLFVTTAGGAETRSLVDEAVLRALGPKGILVNVARGPVVDAKALSLALHSGQLGGAALDVFDDEPNVPQDLIDAPNCLLTPHIGTATNEARRAMATLVLENIAAFVAGKPLPSRYEG